MRPSRGWIVRGIAAALLLLAAPDTARAFDFASDDSAPIDLSARNGLEWQQDSQRFIARQDAVAKRGGVTVEADTLIAHYRETPDGNTEVWRLEAVGNVLITGETGETVTGATAVYEIDQAVLVLRGGDLRLTTAESVVTARDSLEYWELKRMAVARGDAVAVQDPRRISAQVLVAHFKEQDAGATTGQTQDIERIDAYRDVRVKSPTEEATGRRGVYEPDSGIATLTGDVRLLRGSNKLSGGYAVVNMKTGVSTLYPSADRAASDGRVHGLLVPDSRDDADADAGADDDAAAGPTPAPVPDEAPRAVPLSRPETPAGARQERG